MAVNRFSFHSSWSPQWHAFDHANCLFITLGTIFHTAHYFHVRNVSFFAYNELDKASSFNSQLCRPLWVNNFGTEEFHHFAMSARKLSGLIRNNDFFRCFAILSTASCWSRRKLWFCSAVIRTVRIVFTKRDYMNNYFWSFYFCMELVVSSGGE